MPKLKKTVTPELQAQFDGAMARIHEVCCTRTQVQLAEVLGVRQSSISDAKRRRSIPADWQLTILNTFGIDPHWLMIGDGPKFRVLSHDDQGGAVSVSALEAKVKERLEMELSAEGIHEKFFQFFPSALVIMTGPEAKLDAKKLAQVAQLQ